MSLVDTIGRLLKPVRTQVANMIARAVLLEVDDSTKLQTVKLELLASEVRAGLERFQNYGLTSNPVAPTDDGAPEAVVVFPTGRRDHGLVLVVDDRRFRLKSLEPGEVALYTDEGDKIVLKRSGTIELTASTKVHLVTPLVECSTDLKVLGKLDVTGKGTFSDDVDVSKTLTATTDVIGGGKHLKTHTHPGSSLTTTATVSGSPPVGTISGDTGAPN